MKTKIFSLIAILTLSVSVWSQGVGVNETGASPDNSAGLDVDFTNKGLLPPRMTTAQRNAISNPATGLMLFNTTFFCLQVNDGTPASPLWKCISNSAGIPDGVITTIDCWNATNNSNNSFISYTGGNGGVHGGQVVYSTGVTGLTATLAAGTFANGAGTLSYTITGTPASLGTASFAINIGGENCTLIRITNICNPSNPTAIVNVTNPVTGLTWMDRNLGANRAATSLIDEQSYGHLYQWGRGSDGHQCVNRYAGDGVTTSSNTALNATVMTDTPPHGNFIMTNTGNNDWRSPQNINLWQGVNGTNNNPCPTGYRLPTQTELNNERLSWTAGPFASPLKLTRAGNRARSNGSIIDGGSGGYYWSSTVFDTNAQALFFFNSGEGTGPANRASGFSVRCLKD